MESVNFKDINEFDLKETLDGTEEIQVSSTKKVNLKSQLDKSVTANTLSSLNKSSGKPVNSEGIENAITASLNNFKKRGYTYIGVATPATNPGVPDGYVFYLAKESGNYVNFGNILVEEEITLLRFDGSAWHKDNTIMLQNKVDKTDLEERQWIKTFTVPSGSSISHDKSKLDVSILPNTPCTISLNIVGRDDPGLYVYYAGDSTIYYMDALSTGETTFISDKEIVGFSMYGSAEDSAGEVTICVKENADKPLSIISGVAQHLRRKVDIEPQIFEDSAWMNLSGEIVDSGTYFSVLRIKNKSYARVSIVYESRANRVNRNMSAIAISSLKETNKITSIIKGNQQSTLYFSDIPEDTEYIYLTAQVEIPYRIIAESWGNVGESVEGSVSHPTTYRGGNLLSRRFIKEKYPYYFTDDGSDTFPRAYIDGRISNIPKGRHFIFVTDCHWVKNSKKSSYLIDYVRHRIGAKVVINGGDSLDQEDNKYLAAQALSEYVDEFYSAFGEGALYVCGNHDANSTAVSNEVNLDIYEVLIPDTEMYARTIGLSDTSKLVFDTEGIACVDSMNLSDADKEEAKAWFRKHYWYDDAENHIRYIILESCDGGYAMRKIFGKTDLTPAYSSALYLQMDFLFKALSEIPEGYEAVVVSHWMQNSVYYSIYKMIHAFKNGTTTRFSPVYDGATIYNTPGILEWWNIRHNGDNSVLYPFTKKGKVIVIGGHEHADKNFVYGLNGSDAYITDVTEGGSIKDDAINIVWVNRDAYQLRVPQSNVNRPYSPEMNLDTITENSFDVFTITEDGRVITTRIGAGRERLELKL